METLAEVDEVVNNRKYRPIHRNILVLMEWSIQKEIDVKMMSGELAMANGHLVLQTVSFV